MGSTVIEWLHVILTAYLTVGGFLPKPMAYVYISSVVILTWIISGTCPLNIGMGYPKESFTEALLGPGGLKFFMRFFLITNLLASYRTGVILNLILLAIHGLKEASR